MSSKSGCQEGQLTLSIAMEPGGAMALSPVSLKLTELFRLLQQNYGEGAQINRIDSHGQLDEQDSSQQA